MPTREETMSLEDAVADAFRKARAQGTRIVVIGTSIAGQAPELRRQLDLHVKAHDDMIAGVVSDMINDTLTIKATKVMAYGSKPDPEEKDAIIYTFVGE